MRNDSEGYPIYPDPPHGVFSANAMELNLSPDGFGYHRTGQECFNPTTLGFDNSVLYSEAPYNMFGGRMSPPAFQDEPDMRVESSNTSVPSAPSSAMGSPRSNHGQPQPVPEWAGPQGLGVSPSIVGQHDYFPTGTEYTTFHGAMDEFPTTPYDFPQPKAFVGEFARVPRSHGSVSSAVSRGSSSTVVPELAVADVSPVSVSPSLSPASSRKSSIFVSPTTSSSSFSSPPAPAWSSPTCGVDGMSPTARPKLSSFFSQSSGHFVAPLDSSCWFFLCRRSVAPETEC